MLACEKINPDAKSLISQARSAFAIVTPIVTRAYSRMNTGGGKLNYQNSRMYVGIAWSQGGRPCMQDAFAVVLNCDDDPATDFLAVFDGHGPDGGDIARHAALNLFPDVMDSLIDAESSSSSHCKTDERVERAIEEGFCNLDENMRRDGVKNNAAPNGKALRGGATACVVWFRRGKFYCANIGDSRAVVSRRGQAIPVTLDHKPDATREKKRIEAAGGWVERNRVAGVLGVARSFADFNFKAELDAKPSEQVVSVVPDIVIQSLEHVEFLVIATDGVW